MEDTGIEVDEINEAFEFVTIDSLRPGDFVANGRATVFGFALPKSWSSTEADYSHGLDLTRVVVNDHAAPLSAGLSTHLL